MKRKIYDNREVLRGKTFRAKISGHYTDFIIAFVTDKSVEINKSISYKDMECVIGESIEEIVKNVILDYAVDNHSSIAERAFQSSIKLKKIPIIVDGYRFEFRQITNSAVLIGLSINFDNLLENEDDDYIIKVREVILDNLQDNPPKPKKSSYGFSYNLPYLFSSGGSGMYFTTVGPSREIVSEYEIERNKKLFKEQIEKEKELNEKREKFKKEMNFKRKLNTRDLARRR